MFADGTPLAARVSPMTVEKLTFVITTPNFEAALAFYRDLIGLRVLEEWSDFGHGAVLEALEGAAVELIDTPEAATPAPRERTAFIGLQVTDVDEIHARLVAAGASVNAPPTAKPWGGRGFTAFDPDGLPVNVYTAYTSTDDP
jgi:predicted enzyme related to lactoylglutathione lyase